MPALGENLIDRAARQRDDVKIPIRPGLNVRADAESSSEEQAFAFGDVELGEIICDAIFQSRITDRDLAAVARQIEAEQGSALEKIPCSTDDQVAHVLQAECAASHESNASGRDFEFPAKLRIAVMRNRPAVCDYDLAANLTPWGGRRVQVGVGATLAHSLNEIRNGRREPGPGDDVCVIDRSAGDEFVAKFTADYYRSFMQTWEKALNHFLKTGSKSA